MENSIDWKNLGFRLTPTRTMYVAETAADQSWPRGDFIPYGPISFSPAAGVLNYGQGILEGLKAQRTQDGRIVLFRPQENAKRFAEGAQRLCMPPVPESQFVAVMAEMVRQNRDYVPPLGLGSLYLRPCLWGSGSILGMSAAPDYRFVVYASPVGNYFSGGKLIPVKFRVCDTFHRSAPKGVGSIKYIGNYAPTLLLNKQAKADDFAGNVYLDALEESYVEEAGVANFFCMKDNQLLTPKLTDSILPGVIRASVIKLARDLLGIEVIETRLPIETVLQADECFCTGTATVVSPIGSLAYRGSETVYQNGAVGAVTQQIYQSLVDLQTGAAEDNFNWLMDVDQVYAYSM